MISKTHEGGIKPCNRTGIDANPSPFLKMSFETTMHFLTDAALYVLFPLLFQSPSNRFLISSFLEAEITTSSKHQVHSLW
jgi:DNA-directed RNA polymerase I subunit RPA1